MFFLSLASMWGLLLNSADYSHTFNVPFCLVGIAFNNKYSQHIVHDRPALVVRLYPPPPRSISYHFKSARLKTSRAARGFVVEVAGRSGSGGPQPRHFPPEQPLTHGAINH